MLGQRFRLTETLERLGMVLPRTIARPVTLPQTAPRPGHIPLHSLFEREITYRIRVQVTIRFAITNPCATHSQLFGLVEALECHGMVLSHAITHLVMFTQTAPHIGQIPNDLLPGLKRAIQIFR